VNINIRTFDTCVYEPCFHAMRQFTDARGKNTPDEIWFVQHAPVFTLGLAGKKDHVLNAGEIPLVQSDRGGQVTYHGPGQLVCYLLLDMRRHGITVKGLVNKIEQSIIDLLADFHLLAERVPGAPGVYIDKKKIAALGVRIRKGCSYHGFALNIDMDLQPFKRINPCGFPGLEVIQLKDFKPDLEVDEVAKLLLPHLLRNLEYSHYNELDNRHGDILAHSTQLN
jgi:lipoyl(octanoyl) transferase